MIIKGERIRAGRAATPLVHHLLRGEENDAVTVIQGTEDDIRATFGDARALGRTYSLRHFIISPAEEMSRDDALMVLGLLGSEFGFSAESAIVVEHAKPRATADAFQIHWHCLVPEQNAATGRTLSSQFSYLRNEKCARIAEHRLRHKFVIGPHAVSVLSALEKAGHNEVAEALRAALTNASPARPREGFSRSVHQAAKRQGLDVPKARALVRAAWDTTVTREEFESALATHQLRLRAGDKPDTFIIESIAGVFVGAAHRLARVSRQDFFHRVKGRHDARSANSPSERQRVFRTPSRGSEDDQCTPRSDRSADEFRDGRSSGDVTRIDPQGPPRSANQQRNIAPTRGRNRQVRARCRARRLRENLRDHARAEAMMRKARFIASSPVDRVASQLLWCESRLEKRLSELLAPPPPSKALVENRRRAKALEGQGTKLRARIDAAQKAVESLLVEEPRGLRARLDGSHQGWRAQVTRARSKSARLQQQYQSLEARLNLYRNSIDQSDAAAASRHREHLRSASVAERGNRLRSDIEHVRRAQRKLGAAPYLAWGGVVMVMAVAAGISEALQVLEGEFGPGPFPRVFATDIWGVGLPGH